MPDVRVVNGVGEENAIGKMGQEAQEQIERNASLKTEMGIFAGLSIAQLIAYWLLYNDQVNNRDRVLGDPDEVNIKEVANIDCDLGSEYDSLLGFMKYIEERRDRDFEILKDKLNLFGQIVADNEAPDVCEEALRYGKDFCDASQSFNKLQENFAACSCAGIPEGWGLHDNTFGTSFGVALAGSIMTTGAKRLSEEFEKVKPELASNIQTSMKAVYNAQSVFGYYQQALGIFQGLSDLFISGFNSAGATLGIAVGQLASNTQSVPRITTQVKSSPNNPGFIPHIDETAKLKP